MSRTALSLGPEFGRLIGSSENFEPQWLVDNLMAADGLTAITGASKVGKTTLAIGIVRALRDRKAHGGHVLNSWIERETKRVLIIATHGQHVQYAQAFSDAEEQVAIIEVAVRPEAGFWNAYAAAANDFEADLVVIDTVQSLAGLGTPENLDGLSSFACPVLGVFVGYNGTPGVSSSDEYRALAINSLWLRRDVKSGDLSIQIACRWSGDQLRPR